MVGEFRSSRYGAGRGGERADGKKAWELGRPWVWRFREREVAVNAVHLFCRFHLSQDDMTDLDYEPAARRGRLRHAKSTYSMTMLKLDEVQFSPMVSPKSIIMRQQELAKVDKGFDYG